MTLIRSALFNLWSFGVSFVLLPAATFVSFFLPDRMLDFAELNGLLGTKDILQAGRRYEQES